MGKVKFKYFQITEKSALDNIEKCLKSVDNVTAAVEVLIKEFNAKECLQYSCGGVAAFTFKHDALPDMTKWKKVKYGYLPRAKSSASKKLEDLPRQLAYQDVIKPYGLGGEMIIGEPNGRAGIPMYSSGLSGNRKANFYTVKVPYQGEFSKELDPSLVEMKEWEVMKRMEELANSD